MIYIHSSIHTKNAGCSRAWPLNAELNFYGNVVPCPGDGEARAAGEVGGQRRRFGFCIWRGRSVGRSSGVLSRFKRRMDDHG